MRDGVVYRRIGPLLAVGLALAAAGSVALPVLVPAALSRAEYGKARVFHLSRGAYVDPRTGQPTICFFYGVEGRDSGPRVGRSQPELCLSLRPTAAARRLVAELSPAPVGALSAYDIANRLRESGVRPYDRVEDLGLGGLEIAGSEWPNGPVSRAQPQRTASSVLERPVGDAQTRSNVLRLTRYMRACRRKEGGYLSCIDPYRLHSARVRLGAGAGQLAVLAITGNGFTIKATSENDRTFSLRRLGRKELRTCSPPEGLDGCSHAGHW